MLDIFVCFLLFLCLCFGALIEVAICRIILKILCGVILGVIIALTNDLHMGWTLFVIGAIIYCNEWAIADKKEEERAEKAREAREAREGRYYNRYYHEDDDCR